ENEKFIFCYNLWSNNKEFNLIIENICQKYNVKNVVFAKKEDTIEDWLYNIKNAEFVITDSFHGSVFSIIYNVPFISVVKNYPGFSRFKTLLTLFPEIKNNIIFDMIDFNYTDFNIDWSSVNKKIVEEKIRCTNWLKNTIESPKVTYLSEEQKMYDAILNKAEEDNNKLEKEIEKLKNENRILSYTIKIPSLKRKKFFLLAQNIITLGLSRKKNKEKLNRINYILNEYDNYIKNKI
ncbi:polysaccharide pyruvyl transferase family protein, partial [bacterium]|nr:polysaccharide pyruvyl transferase family protein [bacterium]